MITIKEFIGGLILILGAGIMATSSTMGATSEGMAVGGLLVFLGVITIAIK